RLLDTYDQERRAIGELTVEQAYSRYVTRVAPYLGAEGMQAIVDDFSMEIGYRYNSEAVILEPGEEHPLHEHPRESKGRPGARAPHVFLERAGERISTLDLFGAGFALIAAPAGDAWLSAAQGAADELGVPLDAFVVNGGELRDPEGRFADAYGISAAGAVLVRPDGVVGWRALDSTRASATVIRDSLRSLLGLEAV
ncbi:MAG: FAD-dependent monooxygenase, partial [Solirubrobacteraceae bacterium]